VSKKTIKRNTTRRDKGRGQPARRGNACLCAYSPQGRGRGRGSEGKCDHTKFDGMPDMLAEFIDTYESCMDRVGLQGLDKIKGIIKYLEHDD
jgi:hypothetical protein